MEKTTSYQDANMSNPFFLDKNFEGVSDQFFDDALGYFDFPLEDVEPNDVGAEDWQAKFEHLEPPPCDMLVGFSSGFCGGNINESLKARNSSSLVSHDEHSQLKQWPSPAQASSSRSIPLHCHSSKVKYSQVFRTTSPVSVLESSGSSCSAENATSYPKLVTPVKRPRSKHPRTRRCTFHFVAAFCAPKRFHRLAASDPELESCDDEEILNPAKGRRKKRNMIRLSSTEDMGTEMKQRVETRKCTHCEVTKTPQWREGPMGPKTLCNACGVRYRSGRLLPEYRPAASPTFVPFLHSNSHRKVLEMRKQTLQVTPIATTDVLMPAAPAHLF